jgi:hypothetical protein
MISNNSRGQVAETITWIVATLIVILLLVFFIFGASMLGSTRVVKGDFKESLISKSVTSEADLFLKKSLISYYSLSGENTKKSLNKDLVILSNNGNFKGNYSVELRELGGLIGK